MKKIIGLCLISICSTSVFAQNKSMVFKYQYAPNKSYVTTAKTISTIKMVVLDSLGNIDNTPEMPGDIKQNMNMEATMKTGVPGSDKKIPFALSFSKMTMDMEGADKKQSIPVPNLALAKIFGKIANGYQLEVDSIAGAKDEASTKLMNNMLTNVLKSVKFPEKPIKVGDTFVVAMPMNVPLDGGPKIDMKFRMVYKLTAIKDNKGYFDYTANIDANTADKNALNMKMSGDGAGNAIFDLKNNLVSQQHGKLNMKMDINVTSQNKITMDMAIISHITVAVN